MDRLLVPQSPMASGKQKQLSTCPALLGDMTGSFFADSGFHSCSSHAALNKSLIPATPSLAISEHTMQNEFIQLFSMQNRLKRNRQRVRAGSITCRINWGGLMTLHDRLDQHAKAGRERARPLSDCPNHLDREIKITCPSDLSSPLI